MTSTPPKASSSPPRRAPLTWLRRLRSESNSNVKAGADENRMAVRAEVMNCSP